MKRNSHLTTINTELKEECIYVFVYNVKSFFVLVYVHQESYTKRKIYFHEVCKNVWYEISHPTCVMWPLPQKISEDTVYWNYRFTQPAVVLCELFASKRNTSEFANSFYWTLIFIPHSITILKFQSFKIWKVFLLFKKSHFCFTLL